MLNRLGHCVYYALIEQIETAPCLQKLASQSNKNVNLSANINPHVFTTLVWANIDRLEETLSGGGTSHHVNGIVIQPEFRVTSLQASDVTEQEEVYQRSQTATSRVQRRRKDGSSAGSNIGCRYQSCS